MCSPRVCPALPQELRLRLLVLEVLREAVMWSPANGHELAGASGVRRGRPLTLLLRWLLRAVLAGAPAPHTTSTLAAADAGDAVDAGELPRRTLLGRLCAFACQPKPQPYSPIPKRTSPIAYTHGDVWVECLSAEQAHCGSFSP